MGHHQAGPGVTAPTPDRQAVLEQHAVAGFTLVPIPRGTKGPRDEGWNRDPKRWIKTPEQVRDHLQQHPGAGLGVLHSESRTCALDIDSEHAARALAAVGIDLAAVLEGNLYRVRGRRGEKPLFRAPEGLSFRNKALAWPDPSGKKGPGGRPAPVTLFELRGGPVQDVLPGSTHPETGQPYVWAGPVPASVQDLPELPPELLSLWQRWEVLEPVMKAACPWASTPPEALPRPREPGSWGGEGGSVVAAFNTSRTVGEVLKAHGYRGPERGPWTFPHSSSGHAGVRLLPDPTSGGHPAVYSHHAADPLGDGQARDAFGVWALLDHGVDLQTASPEERREVVKAAARFLDLPEPERGSAVVVGKSGPLARDLPAVEWGEVRPLPPLTQPVPPLPPELLPGSLASSIQDEARAAGLPLEVVAAPVLGGAGGMIGRRLTLRNAPNAPAVTCNPSVMICDQPGGRKSHALTLGSAPLARAETAEKNRLDAERPGLETARDVAAARLEGLQSTLKRAMKAGRSGPDMPSDDELTEAREALREAEAALIPKRFMISDATIETVGVILASNSYGVTLVRDELNALLKSFEKPGRESERAQYLELLNGDAVLRVDRMSREALYVPGASVGVMGTIQPGPLAALLESQRGAGDGLLQRFQLFIWPDSAPPFDQAAQRLPLNKDVKEAAARLLDALPSLMLTDLGSIYPSGEGALLVYTPQAQAVFDTWEVEHEREKRDMSLGEAYRSHISKQPATFARLALLFHALEVVAAGGPRHHPQPAQVGEEAAMLAAAWCDYLGLHARKLWREGRRTDVLDARAVLGYIERGRIQDGQRVSEVRRVLAENRERFTGERLQAALRVLQECGAVEVVTPEQGKQGGRPSPVLRVNPQALDADAGER